MRVRTTKSVDAVNSERVIPDDPTAAMKTDLLGFDFQFRGILVTDRQPKCTIGLERPMRAANPLATPIEIIIRLFRVIINIVLVADIERRVGKHEVDRPWLDLFKQADTVALMNLVFRNCHTVPLLDRADFKRFALEINRLP